MKKKYLYISLVIILIFAVFKIYNLWSEKQIITFSDALMEKVVYASIGKDINTDNVTRADIHTITELDLGFVTSFTTLMDLNKLKNLEELYINVNLVHGDPTGMQYTDADPKPSNDQIVSEFSKILPRLNSLTELIIANYDRNLVISDLSFLSKCTSLEKFSLLDTNITELSGLKNMKKLTYLSLERNEITDISTLKSMKKLTELNLDDNKITDISALQNLSNLSYLWLNYNNLTDISALENLNNLTILGLDNNKLSDISALSNLIKLEILDLT